MTLGVAEGNAEEQYSNRERPDTLMLKSSKMIAGLEWRMSISWCQRPRSMNDSDEKEKKSVSLNSTTLTKEAKKQILLL